jgi:hypothetical protein
MHKKKRVFTLRVDDELYDKLKVIADKNKRSLNGQIELLIEQCVVAFEKENGMIEVGKEG